MDALQTTTSGMSLSLLSLGNAPLDDDLIREWTEVMEVEESLNHLYSSPSWFEHLRLADAGEDLRLGLIRDEDGRLAGVCPVRLQPYTLPLDVWSHALARIKLRAVAVPGAEPLFPAKPHLFRRFFDAIFQEFPHCDCVYLPTVAKDNYAWEFFREEAHSSPEYFVYLPYGSRPWHWLKLEGDFESYLLAQMGKKGRYNLRRTVRLLREHGGGSLECERVTSADQIADFLPAAAEVSAATWQRRVLGSRIENSAAQAESLRDLAERRLLRAYLLRCGGRPVAFAIGYQFEQVFHYVEVGFDQSFASFSPGTALLYLIVEDLFRHDSPAILNFGIGDAPYKRRFSNREGRDACVILFRRTLRNRLRRFTHRWFLALVEGAKRILRRKTRANPTVVPKELAV